MKNTYVLVEFRNSEPYVEKIIHENDISFSDIVSLFEERYDDINWDRDSISLIDVYDYELEK